MRMNQHVVEYMLCCDDDATVAAVAAIAAAVDVAGLSLVADYWSYWCWCCWTTRDQKHFYTHFEFSVISISEFWWWLRLWVSVSVALCNLPCFSCYNWRGFHFKLECCCIQKLLIPINMLKSIFILWVWLWLDFCWFRISFVHWTH